MEQVGVLGGNCMDYVAIGGWRAGGRGPRPFDAIAILPTTRCFSEARAMDGTMEPKKRRGHTRVIPTDLQTSARGCTTKPIVNSLSRSPVCSESNTRFRSVLGRFHLLMKEPKNLAVHRRLSLFHCLETTTSGSRNRITSSSVRTSCPAFVLIRFVFDSVVVRTPGVSRLPSVAMVGFES